MKTFVYISLVTLLSGSIALATESKNSNALQNDWLPKGESIDVFEYNSNNPHSPAAFSTIDSKTLNANLH